MAGCLYAGSIKKVVSYLIFRPPVGGRSSVYCITGLGSTKARSVALLGSLDHTPPPGLPWAQA